MRLIFNFGFIYADRVYSLYMNGILDVEENSLTEHEIVNAYDDSEDYYLYFQDTGKYEDIKQL